MKFGIINFRAPVTTTHAVVRENIKHHQHMVERFQSSESFSPYHRERIIELRQQTIAKEESKLSEPNRLVFPTFFWINWGSNTFGISLKGFTCDIPTLARKYGTPCDAAGGTLHYRNWLGSHWDF